MTDNTQQQPTPESVQWLESEIKKAFEAAPDVIKPNNGMTDEERKQGMGKASLEEIAAAQKLYALEAIARSVNDNTLGIEKLDEIKKNYEALQSNPTKADEYLNQEAKSVYAEWLKAQPQDYASGATRGDRPDSAAADFDAAVDEPSEEADGPITRFLKNRRDKKLAKLYSTVPLNEALHGYWPNYDPDAGIVAALAQYMDVKKYRDTFQLNGALIFNTYDGGQFCWRMTGDGEFIGKTNGMSNFGKNPINEGEAQGIVAMARARGWQSINLYGTSQEKENIWTAAMEQNLKAISQKMGIKNFEINSREDLEKLLETAREQGVQIMGVKNFIPSDACFDKFRSWAAKGKGLNPGYSGVTQATETPDAPESRFAGTTPPEGDTAAQTPQEPKGPAKGTSADADNGPKGPARGNAQDASTTERGFEGGETPAFLGQSAKAGKGNGPSSETRFSKTADEQPSAEKPAEDAAAKAPKTGRGSQGRKP